MKVKLLKSLWGMTGSLEQQVESIVKAGYIGIEAPLPADDQADKFKELLKKYNLDYIPQIFTSGDNHEEAFSRSLEKTLSFQPLFVNAHSARDRMTDEEQDRFYAHALAEEKKAGVAVAHETHRHRAMYSPWTTARLLNKFPDLKITADFSHWCCVCESLLGDMQDFLSIAMERAIHIHARVGYGEGPQVPNPAAPEYAGELARHEGWWEEIIKLRKAEGRAEFTVTPEFGPPNYMHTLPFTNQPVSDLWEVNLWMANRFRAKYN